MPRNILPLYTEVPQETHTSSGFATVINSVFASTTYSYNIMGRKIINFQTTTRPAAIFT